MLVRLRNRWASSTTLAVAPLLSILFLATAGTFSPTFAQADSTGAQPDTSAAEPPITFEPPVATPPPPPPPPTPAQPLINTEEEAEDEASTGDGLAGMGSLGFSIGAMKFLSGNELSDGAVRPILHGQFKYVLNDKLVIPLEGGWGWNAYGEGGGFEGPDSVGTLAVATPLTVGIDYRFQTGKPSVVPRVGAGVGLYLLSIRSGRTTPSRDPVTDQKRKSTSPGLYGKGGVEFMLSPTFWLNTDLMYHMVLSADSDKYPRGWLDDNASFAELRVGLNYYFTIRGDGASVRGGSDEDEE
jgi:opacity protein-like surface antigen